MSAYTPFVNLPRERIFISSSESADRADPSEPQLLENIADKHSMTFSDGKTCPHCHTESLHRSHRRGRDWFFNLIGLRPMRCTCCTRRFYAPKLPQAMPRGEAA